MTVRVLIIDDSSTTRAILMSRLSGEGDIEVVGTARDAQEGRQAIKALNPDVVTLDIEMPGMNGLDFLEKIMTLRPTPVIIVSGSTQAGNEVTARALSLGAVDCYDKSDQKGGLAMDDNGKLATLIRRASEVKFDRVSRSAQRSAATTTSAVPTVDRGDTKLIAIGSSTGGVEALHTVLSSFPEDCPPTVIVQHINARFAEAVAQSLDKICPAKVQIATPDTPLKSGNVYFAQGDGHLMIGGADQYHCRVRAGEPVSGHLPSVDVLFQSVAERVGSSAVGILLTGMGRDGAQGMKAMVDTGAFTIAQNEATCTVFGMPRAAIELGAASVVAPIGEIAQHALPRSVRKAA